jgi:hypothetical protein
VNLSLSFFSFSKKLFPFTLVLLLIGSSAISISAKNDVQTKSLNDSKTWYIKWDAPDGGNGSINHPFNNIQDGIDNSTSRDTVYLFPGIYNNQNYLVNKSITIRGENKETTEVTNPYNADFLFTVTADNVTFTNLDFKNAGPKRPYRKILIQSDYCTITDNIFSDLNPLACTMGIMLNGANHTSITANAFGIPDTLSYQTAPAISVNNSNNTVIENNNITGLYLISMYLLNAKNTIIRGNDIHNIVVLESSSHTLISYNNLSGTKALSFTDSSDNTITYNNFGKHKWMYLQRVEIFNRSKWVFTYVGSQVDLFNSTNLFNQNYWGRPRALPKILFGYKTIHEKIPDAIIIDWHPAKTPNLIP